MDVKPREFRGIEDLPKVKAFLVGRQRWDELPDYWNAGKSTVGTFQTLFGSTPTHHRFWEDANGELHAYVWLCPEPGDDDANSWRMLIHPGVRREELAADVLTYAEKELTEVSGQRSASEPMKTVAYESDRSLASMLEQHGYSRENALDVYMQRGLDQPLAEPDPAHGYVVRKFEPKTDLVQRAGVQIDAFGGIPEPGEGAMENIRRFVRWYEGREDLDLVAVSPTNEIASFAVFLIDPVTLVGELDPVGTRASHRRKGLATAVLLSGLQYMKKNGMASAVVRTGVGNSAAISLYESVGFRVVDKLYRYTKSPS